MNSTAWRAPAWKLPMNDDPGRHRVGEAVGVPHGQDLVPDLEPGGIAERQHRERVRGFDLQDGTRGLLYINATDAPRTTRLVFGPGRDGARAVSVWPDTGTPVVAGVQRTMKPREVLFLRTEGR
jgi:hypothetical protein